MKVGLVRHFEVKRGYPNKLVSADELMKWVEEYDASEVFEKEIDLCGVDWKRCFSSDLLRAEITARTAFKGQIEFLEELREVALSPFFRVRMRIPLFMHLLFIRGAWLFNHKSQPESKAEVKHRIHIVLDKILASGEDVLVVGHGGIMMYMREELLKRGFTGPKFRRAANGQVYIFEKE
ncbi:histidine phosphatase family protein [Bacillus sp. T33-2]|uniref:histidine phosphatase family protein n=1 Tax=Bacillus sp. T33-2 TaxID=2054168 RepID=UPI000C75B3A0|nr:histidine phosphatase family protein [Bacillus sp. T33-2]PLR98430.1 phosphoglycerate mutase [Bacillus sp. T33-2]